MSAVYTRRVSFDSLNPNIQVEPDEPIHIPPQYQSIQNFPNDHESNQQQQQQSNKRGLDLNFGYEPTGYNNKDKNQDLFKIFDSFQELNNKLNYKAQPASNGQNLKIRRKTPKLPPPPSKSILKKNYTFNNQDYIINETETIPKNLPDDSITSILPSQQRKKSIVEMSPEELLEMDKQYQKTSVSNLDKFEFDGDNYLPLHNLTSFDQSYKKNRNQNLNNVDKLVGNIVTINNKKLFKSNNKNINFKSYSVNFKHGDMTKFIQNYFNDLNQESNAANQDDKHINENYPNLKHEIKQSSESLRDLIIYISGRKHTWDSINWVLKNFLINGDHLIIISQLPTLNSINDPNSGYDTILDDYDDYDDEITSEFIKEKVDSLSSYIFKCIELLGLEDLKISITIEFIKDKSVKNLIKNSINLYNPNFFLISSLISNRLSIKFENNNIKLPFYLMKNLNLSTIIIPDLLIDRNYTSLNKDEIIKSPIPDINIDSGECLNGEIDYDNYLSKLNNISDIYKNAINTDSLSRSNSNSNTSSSLNIEQADTPSNYYPNSVPNSGTKIKFSDNLSIPRYNYERSNSNYSNSNSQFSSPLSSRRNSNNSSGIYKVKSLLDDDQLSTKTSNSSKSGGGGGGNNIERSKSIPINERRLSSHSIGSRHSKSVDEGTPKKSGFLAKLGFKRK
ncbi:hypothetical protein BN7_3604 [Wickerhamomyces ciferrii]|uniref:Uncharacterized protein n=1 Tax=Wickerhamomyces ciferrii (strain ATCC 14091 / BCRC 22168 / CBS 111 / JCM 3599 / NBRC 0793 / NRRL Y-1031 F-60-10) TaxID=1206466 RepID=K0KFV9_WICCF|nr:uncharacterized protein BN7_3604 [Wickerhamomyces ciferrii]CCH44045.1 hypothetical protein BN7_3604 [Wickerhamomyces ciferrii]